MEGSRCFQRCANFNIVCLLLTVYPATAHRPCNSTLPPPREHHTCCLLRYTSLYQSLQPPQRLPITLPELVDASPSLTDDGSVILGRRLTRVYVLDRDSGALLQTLAEGGGAAAAAAAGGGGGGAGGGHFAGFEGELQEAGEDGGKGGEGRGLEVAYSGIPRTAAPRLAPPRPMSLWSVAGYHLLPPVTPLDVVTTLSALLSASCTIFFLTIFANRYHRSLQTCLCCSCWTRGARWWWGGRTTWCAVCR